MFIYYNTMGLLSLIKSKAEYPHLSKSVFAQCCPVKCVCFCMYSMNPCQRGADAALTETGQENQAFLCSCTILANLVVIKYSSCHLATMKTTCGFLYFYEAIKNQCHVQRHINGGFKTVHIVHMALFHFQLFSFLNTFTETSKHKSFLPYALGPIALSQSAGCLWLTHLIRDKARCGRRKVEA